MSLLVKRTKFLGDCACSFTRHHIICLTLPLEHFRLSQENLKMQSKDWIMQAVTDSTRGQIEVDVVGMYVE